MHNHGSFLKNLFPWQNDNPHQAWNDLIKTYETNSNTCFSIEKIKELLQEIQDYIRSGIPEDQEYDQKLRFVTDKIYEVSVILAHKPGVTLSEDNLRVASRNIYLAIIELLDHKSP